MNQRVGTGITESQPLTKERLSEGFIERGKTPTLVNDSLEG